MVVKSHHPIYLFQQETYMNYFQLIADIFIGYKNYNKAVKELSSLSDYELKDIGISRGEIYKVAADRSF